MAKISLNASNFNAPSYGGEDTHGKIKAGDGQVFNDKGELNAYDKQDAVRQLAATIQNLMATGGGVSKVASQSKIYASATDRAEYFNTLKSAIDSGPEGMKIAGETLLNPIREILDYEGFARKCLAVREIGPGEIPRYDRDIYPVAWVVARDGITPESHITARYFYPEEFLVTANINIDIRDIYQMQYDSLARSQDRARQAVEYREDAAFINVIDAASTTVNDIVYPSTWDWSGLIDLKYEVEKNRIPCDKFLFNMAEVNALLKNLNYQHIDPITTREIVLNGYIGNIAGVDIIVSAGNGYFEPVPSGTVYALSRPEYVGGMPIRIPLQSEPINKFFIGEPVKGWFLYEMIGQVVLNPRGVAKAVLV